MQIPYPFLKIAASAYPPGYFVSRSGRIRPPPRAWRVANPQTQEGRGVPREQMDLVAPLFKGKAVRFAESERSEHSQKRSVDVPECQDCTICLEELKNPETKRMLLCQHLYHSHCIESWAAKNNACPNCRTEICADDNASDSGSPAVTSSRGVVSAATGPSRSNQRMVTPTMNASTVVTRLYTSNATSNGSFWNSPRAADATAAPFICRPERTDSSAERLGMSLETSGEPLRSPPRLRPSPKRAQASKLRTSAS